MRILVILLVVLIGLPAQAGSFAAMGQLRLPKQNCLYVMSLQVIGHPRHFTTAAVAPHHLAERNSLRHRGAQHRLSPEIRHQTKAHPCCVSRISVEFVLQHSVFESGSDDQAESGK